MLEQYIQRCQGRIKKQGGNSKDVAYYCENLPNLLETGSDTIHHETLRKLRPYWDGSFENYYMNCLHDDISSWAGRRILEDLKIYCPFSGITNNQSKSLNRYVLYELS